jgi:hypothetical protein
MRADDLVVLRFHHDRHDAGQFRDLAAEYLLRRDRLPVGLTMRTLGDGRDDNVDWVVHEGAREALVAKGRPVFFARRRGRHGLFLVARRGLGRIARSGRRWGQAGDFGLQAPHFVAQERDERQEFGVRATFELGGGRLCHESDR